MLAFLKKLFGKADINKDGKVDAKDAKAAAATVSVAAKATGAKVKTAAGAKIAKARKAAAKSSS